MSVGPATFTESFINAQKDLRSSMIQASGMCKLDRNSLQAHFNSAIALLDSLESSINQMSINPQMTKRLPNEIIDIKSYLGSLKEDLENRISMEEGLKADEKRIFSFRPVRANNYAFNMLGRSGLYMPSVEEQIDENRREQSQYQAQTIHIGNFNNQINQSNGHISNLINDCLQFCSDAQIFTHRMVALKAELVAKIAARLPSNNVNQLDSSNNNAFAPKVEKTEISQIPQPVVNKITLSSNPGQGNSYIICGQGGGLSWNPQEGKPLQTPRNQWSIQIPSVAQEFKVVLVNKDGSAIWQDGANLSLKNLADTIQFGSQTAKIALDASNKLTVSFEPKEGSSLVLCGLNGNWNPSQGLALNTPNDQWSFELPAGAEQYKIVLKKADGSFDWEKGPNRVGAQTITQVTF